MYYFLKKKKLSITASRKHSSSFEKDPSFRGLDLKNEKPDKKWDDAVKRSAILAQEAKALKDDFKCKFHKKNLY